MYPCDVSFFFGLLMLTWSWSYHLAAVLDAAFAHAPQKLSLYSGQ